MVVREVVSDKPIILQHSVVKNIMFNCQYFLQVRFYTDVINAVFEGAPPCYDLLRRADDNDLGTEPYQEFLTLILKPRIAFLCGYSRL